MHYRMTISAAKKIEICCLVVGKSSVGFLVALKLNFDRILGQFWNLLMAYIYDRSTRGLYSYWMLYRRIGKHFDFVFAIFPSEGFK